MTKSKGARGRSNATKSLSFQFRTQLNDLMQSLYKTDSRYIRCVKPNQNQAPKEFVSVLVNEQLKYSGVYEAVEIRKQGFPFRLTYAQFACRYSCINMRDSKRVKQYRANIHSNARQLCQEILQHSRFDFSSVVFGKTMCLYKTDSHRLLTLLRELNLAKLIPMAQAVIRGSFAREFKRRCAKCDRAIQQALNVGNDIDLLDRALQSIPSTLGSLAGMFPTGRPNLEKVAMERREALLRWKELEAEFDRLVKTMNGGESELKELKGFLAEASQILDTPRTQNQINLYEEATEHHNALEIRLQTQRIEANIARYSDLTTFGNMRTPEDYVRKVKLGKKGYKEKIGTWQKSKLPTSVTKLGEDLELIKRAKASFEAVKEFSGQKKSKVTPTDMMNTFFNFAKESQQTSDEAWVHLLKNVTNNPKEDCVPKVWELIAMAIYTIRPSEALEDYVVFKLREAPNGQAQNYLSAFHAAKYDGALKNSADTMMPTQVAQQGRNRYSTRL